MAVRLCVVLMLLTGTAAADEFQWEAPAGCPDLADVRRRIELRLADDVGFHGIAVTVTRENGSFVANIDTRAITVANNSRTLRSRRCSELADAVAVIVARLATEANLKKTPPVEMPAMPVLAKATDDEAPFPSPVRPVAVVRRLEPRAAENPLWGGGVRALAVSGIGVVPSVGVAGELGVFVRRQDTFAELAYARWAESPTFLVAGAPGRVDVSLQMFAVRGGWASRRMPLRAWVGIEAGMMSGAGVALRDPREGESRWTAVASGFGVAWPMSPHTRLVGTFEVGVNLERATFALEDGKTIYEPSRASARCAVGLEVGIR